MFYTYIIFSKTLDKYYTGSCENIENRLNYHLNSRSSYTKVAKDWVIFYFENFEGVLYVEGGSPPKNPKL